MDYNSFDLEKIRIQVNNFSVFHIIHMIEQQNINLFPDFQRNIVWDDIRKSRLIESLMLNIPMPIFYVSENTNGVWDVVDGMQRLNAIWQYSKNAFKLRGLEYLNELNGMGMDELPRKFVQRILNASLTFHVIDSRTPSSVRLEIFRRLNTGGIALNAQEIRNSFITENARYLINKLSENDVFLRLVDSGKNIRMNRQELIIRFLAFYEAYNDNSSITFRGRLSDFLNEFTQYLNTLDDYKLDDYYYLFRSVMSNAEILFGEYAFHRLFVDDKSRLRKKGFSKPLFTCQCVILSKYNLDYRQYRNARELIINKITYKIREDSNVVKAINTAASTPKEIDYQYDVLSRLIEELIRDVEKY
ncbi:hypothetical protein AU385_13910 [Bacillus halotolerans]|uniref:DUF262 domain-containing protein n=1 Tax=Bacillus halotolerans TaxID=260554 RepID=UPI0007505A1D|nr:DUF262 domain-containing protein [Bacillus halotolerans]KUP31875.1 hypothetical protein AU385_13910 [Bacillus halotolerans]